MQINFNAMEKKRQEKRASEQVYKVAEDPQKAKFYILDMFPYPSGAGLHVGHPKGFVATDTLARKKMLEGFSVLHPMGFDTFGLGTEQYAIDNKMKPQDVATKNITYYKQQLEKIWFSYDRERSFSTADPEYFKWTQWIFLQLYTHYYDEEKKQARPISEYKGENPNDVRLAYIDYKPINRCPHCKTGLANEDLEDGKCERCGSEVEQRPMRQWVLRITKYADRLLEGLDELHWDESMKELERNRIWKSSGTEFEMVVATPLMKGGRSEATGGSVQNELSGRTSPTPPSEGGKFRVFTTRIDTVFGMTFVVMAPEHPLVDQITTDEYREPVEAYKQQAKYKTQLERTELQKEKTGQFTGAYAINPFSGKEVPIFIGDYVLANYGTGVVMAVPAHDERDFEFAKKYDIPIVQSIMPIEWTPNEKAERRETINAVIQRKSDGKFLFVRFKKFGWIAPIVGGIDEGETPLQAAEREVLEETGYKTKALHTIWRIAESNFFAENKNVWRQKITHDVVLELIDETPLSVADEEKEKQEAIWLTYQEALEQVTHKDNLTWIKAFVEWETAFCEKWRLINSWDFTWLTSDEAIKAMQQRLAERNLGGEKSNYKIQDWVFSRQRYWGEPFPVVFCKHCGEAPLQKGGKLHTINFYDQDTREGIKTQKKTIETRALNPEEPERYFGNIKVGEVLKMVNKETNEVLYAKITEKFERKNFEELFTAPTLAEIYRNKQQFKSVKTVEDLKEHYNFTPWYIEKIETNGLVGRRFELIDISKVNPLPESALPLTLPDIDNYEPTGREEGPLDDVDWRMKTTCPICWNEAKRESNTMPGRAGSSRYRLRYMDPKNDQTLVNKENEHYRKNVDVYVGGAEHVTRHMIYARFWQKFLYDIGVVSQQEPFQRYEKVWLIMAQDGRKMSKRRWNVVNPDDVIAEYGADAFRMYEMFMGPFDQFISRNTNGLKGVRKFLDKVVALRDKVDTSLTHPNNNTQCRDGSINRPITNDDSRDDGWTPQNCGVPRPNPATSGVEIPQKTVTAPKHIETLLHQTIKKTTEDIDAFRFNTTISQFMILANALSEQNTISRQLFETFIILLAPFAPHLAEEFRSLLGNKFSIFTKAKRPQRDETKLISDTVILAIQFNGKVRGTLEVSPTASQEKVLELIKGTEKLNTYLTTSEVKKIIYLPWKIMNIVIA